MSLASTRYATAARIARMLSPAPHLKSSVCHFNSSLPQLRAGLSSSSSHAASRHLSAWHLPGILQICSSSPSQNAEYSVLSYSSTETYSPQQLAELREDARDTIVALSSGSGRAGVAVIRVSGPRADDILQKVLTPGRALPQPRLAAFASISSPITGEALDRGLILRFPGPASFTGEDVVELHTHGGPAVVRAVLEALQRQPGVRLAEPGEFTQRAFQAGKLDLTEVEGLADLLAAETEAQRVQALRQSGGAMRKAMATWRSTLLRCLASTEAIIDFGEDEEISAEVSLNVLQMAKQLRQHLQEHVSSSRRGELTRTGIKVAIVGRTNAGKSSLLNALAARDAAIVSSTPGTTRDTIEVAVDLAGHKVTLVDTAGLRESTDDIERMGMERARSAMTSADIIAVVLDLHSEPDLAAVLQRSQQQQHQVEGDSSEQGPLVESALMTVGRGLIKEVIGSESVGQSSAVAGESQPDSKSIERGISSAQQNDDSAVSRPQHQKTLLVLNKSDLQPLSQQSSGLLDNTSTASQQMLCGESSNGSHPVQSIGRSSLQSSVESVSRERSDQSDNLREHEAASLGHERGEQGLEGVADDVAGVVAISCKTGDGLDSLLARLSQLVADMTDSGDAGDFVITRLRHRQLIEECIEALLRFEYIYEQPELAAEELRAAAHALGKVTGVIDTEDVLDAIFSEFCIGK